MKLHLTFTLVLLSTAFTVCLGQTNTGKINSIVTDIKNKPIESATASLLNPSDSSVIKLTASDKMGRFGFENLPNGKSG